MVPAAVIHCTSVVTAKMQRGKKNETLLGGGGGGGGGGYIQELVDVRLV